jgi:hypothetical protein
MEKGTGSNPFIDPEGYRKFLKKSESGFREILKKQQSGKAD